MAGHARKELHKRRDVVSDATASEVEAEIGKLETAADKGDETAIKSASESLDKAFGKVQPARDDGGWRENCEVVLVAVVLAIALRAYFLQPFQIPTGSMQPTLNGIIAHPVPAGQPLPNFLVKGFQALWLGRSYVDVASEVDDQVIGFQPEKKFAFMEYTRIVCASGRSYLVHASEKALRYQVGSDGFGVAPGRHYRAGESIVHGYIDTGDKVFVDKFTYNFRLPRRADVFVFSTKDLPIPMDDPHVKSEFYIKRLAAQGGDTLRIEAPNLYRNGPLAPEKPFQRVMSARDGYRGYSNYRGFHYLTEADETFTLPADSYFALGDNSYNSSDSRNWGTVPKGNVVGRGLFVYWPFGRHWGFVN